MLTTVGCVAVSPIVATALLGRPLKFCEAHILFGSCLIPIIGGWLVNEAYNHHIFTAPDEQPVASPLPLRPEPVRRVRRAAR